MAKKTERGILWVFSTYMPSQNIKKIEGGPFGEKTNLKKSLTMRKNLKGGPFSLSRYCMLRGRRGKIIFGSVR